MRLKDFKLFEPLKIDTTNLFRQINDNTFFINSYCIQTPEQQVHKGKTYLLFYESFFNKELQIKPISVLLVLLSSKCLYIIVKDAFTSEQTLLKHILDDGSTPCHWIIVDIEYLQAKIDELTKKEYSYDKRLRR